MLRPSPTIISLSKRDVREHVENVGRKATTSRRGGAEQATKMGFAMRPLYNRPSTFTSDETDEIAQLEQPPSRLMSFEDSEASGTEDVYQLTGLSLQDDHPDEGIDLRHPLTLRSLESRWQETPLENNLGNVRRPSQDSSSFVPDDVSTPQQARLPSLHRLRVRNPLPRSPLYRSYSHRASSEGTRSVGLASHLASPGIPGVLFSQPARRPRDYRLRTPAFSGEESNKSRSILEDFDVSESDSRFDLPLPIERSRLYGASMQSSDGEVSHPSSPPTRVFHPSGVTQPEDEIVSVNATDSEVSLHSVRLPPPFSTSSRNGSATGSLPAGDSSSTGRSPRSHHGGDGGDRTITPSGLAGIDDITRGQELEQSPRSGSTTSNVSSGPFRLVSAYRSRSPIGPWHLPSRLSRALPTTPRVPRDNRIASSATRPGGPANTNTPYRRLRVYDERVPASLQPQTPEQLPEARHYSHYHASYTAPAGRRHASAQQTRWETPHRQWRRSGSPAGLDTPGFAGLYGGQENTDDDVMFEQAAQRLFLRHGE